VKIFLVLHKTVLHCTSY